MLGRVHFAIAILTLTTSAVFLLALMVLIADEWRPEDGGWCARLVGAVARQDPEAGAAITPKPLHL